MKSAAPFVQITRPSGEAMPIGFRALGLAARRPRFVQNATLRVLLRSDAVIRRLPEWAAHYADGRAFICPAGDRMYASVLCHGVWEPVESSVLASVLRPGDFAVDVGANHGWHSIGMARIVGGSGLVWAFEPVPRIAAALERNLSRNPGLKVEAFPLALGHSSGTATIHVFQGLPEGHASTRTLGREDYHRYDVPRRSLDEVLAAGAPRPALVKVDVEGSDLDVLKGASELARGPDAPMWLLEVNWEVSRAFGYEPPDLLTFLRELADYRTYRLGKGRAWPEVEPRSAPQASAWLAVPRHRLERIHRVRVNA